MTDSIKATAENSNQLWSRAFITSALINFALILVFYLLLIVITVYAQQAFNASMSMGGLIMGLFIVGALVGRLSIGSLMPKMGLKPTLMLGLSGFALASLLYFVKINIEMLLFTRFIQGFMVGIASTATGTFAAQVIPAARKGEGISYFGMSSTLATAIGPFVGITLMQYTNFNVLFGLCTVIAIAIWALAWVTDVPALYKPKAAQVKRGFRLDSFIETKALPVALVIVLIALGYASVLAFINAYASEQNLLAAAKWFFLVYALVVLLSRPFTGRLLDSHGANAVMYPAFIVFALGLSLLSFANSGMMLLASAVLMGLGFGNMQSSTQAIIVRLAEPHRIGVATTTFFMAMEIGLGFGPYFLGLLLPLTGFHNLYLLMAVLVMLSMGVYVWGHGRHEKALR